MSSIETFLDLIGINAISYSLYSLILFLCAKYVEPGSIAEKVFLVPTYVFFCLSLPSSLVLDGIVTHHLNSAYDGIMEEVKEKEKEKEEKRREEWRKQDENSRIHMEIQMEIAKDRAVKRERAAIAQRLLTVGESVEKITRCTGLSVGEVQSLAQQKSG